MADPKVIIGVDFGTTFSGFASTEFRPAAVAQVYNAMDIFTTDDYPDSRIQKFYYPKTLTALYYHATADGNAIDRSKPVLCGWPARTAAMANKSSKPWQYQYRFKLRLKHGTTEKTDPNLPPLPPGITDVVEMIADYLRGFKEFIMKMIRPGISGPIQIREVKWCITVPAQWDQGARTAMHRAAQMAGMIRNDPLIDNGGSSFPLVIVLEPEAASLYCFNKAVNPEAVTQIQNDCGGGTVDLVVHRLEMNAVKQKFASHAVSQGTGALCGGTYVDLEFIRVVKSKYVAKFLPAGWKHGDPGHPFDEFKSQRADRYAKRFNGTNGFGFEFPTDVMNCMSDPDADELFFSVAEIESMFEPALKQIYTLVDDQLQQNPQVRVLFVVGGFSESPYLQEKMKARFSDKIVATVPKRGSAIMYGAVLHGLDPDLIPDRCSSITFGVNAAVPALDGDAQADCIEANGKRMYKWGFDVIVKRDQIISTTEPCRKRFTPNTPGRDIEVILYATMMDGVRTIKDPRLQKVAKLKIPAGTIQNFGKGGIEVFLSFGSAIIEMWAVDLASGQGVPKQAVDFDEAAMVLLMNTLRI